jgi:hypothetical protein
MRTRSGYLAVLALTASPAGPNTLKNTLDRNNKVAGFWQGLWQGFICLFTFVVSLFSDSSAICEVHNNGALYNLGFLLGVPSFYGGGGAEGHAAK